ncbi:hypothetical protein FF011L_30180 [Roseimaritima multifibrata]|uniref:Uncharacterized protein n=1 Tax=Roseimaritima multifibrata TaxID=1930274 RepID=A0A517MH92_9BACT|nr:hypothetical protein [Roseimaritima multifibrata]QDS94239.1 hypothetical protein FF011L_30180 [Roseimaritima multifibrata]
MDSDVFATVAKALIRYGMAAMSEDFHAVRWIRANVMAPCGVASQLNFMPMTAIVGPDGKQMERSHR